MISKDRLVFDTADAADSDKVGSFILGSGGAVVESKAIGGTDWLQVASATHDKDGDGIDSTANAMWVHIKGSDIAIDLDIRDLSHTQDSVKVGDGTDFLAIAADGSIAVTDNGGSLTVDATQLDIDDLNATDDAVAAWMKDGSGTSITSTGGALDVNITNAAGLDAALANSDFAHATTSVGTTAVAVVTAALASRKYITVQNLGNKSMYLGKAAVTTSNGLRLSPGSTAEFRLGAAQDLYAISTAAGQDLRVFEAS